MAYQRRCVENHRGGGCDFLTADGKMHSISGRWDLIIAHPPCTYLTCAGNRCYSLRCTPAEKVIARMKKREEAIVFFLRLYFADCDHIAVENPKGRISSVFEPPTQYVDPYMFAKSEADSENYVSKRTGLWLKGLPPLITNTLLKPEPYAGYRIQRTTGKLKANTWTERQKGQDRAKIRSKTFPGIARAMAEQWIPYIESGIRCVQGVITETRPKRLILRDRQIRFFD